MSIILVISTSLRVNSNSEVLANEFVRGAKDAGNDVEVLSLKKKSIAFCQGCLTCGNAKLSGTVFAGGVNDGGDIKNHKSLQAAYELGKSIKA